MRLIPLTSDYKLTQFDCGDSIYNPALSYGRAGFLFLYVSYTVHSS